MRWRVFGRMGRGWSARAGGMAGLVAGLLMPLQLGADPPGAGRALAIPAAGRISYGAGAVPPGGAICSAVLVAPDLILTAGHCVKAAAAQTILFRAGYAHGVFAAEARGAEVVFPAVRSGLAGDLALVRLDRALEGVAPLDLAPRMARSLRMLAYRRDMPERRAEAGCAVLADRGDVLGLGCAAVSGNSGAPLIQRGPAGWEVVAIMVAQDRGTGPLRSYAVRVPEDLAARIAAARQGGGGGGQGAGPISGDQ